MQQVRQELPSWEPNRSSGRRVPRPVHVLGPPSRLPLLPRDQALPP